MKDTTKILLFGILMFFCASLRIWSTPDLPYHAFRDLSEIVRWLQFVLIGVAGLLTGAYTTAKEELFNDDFRTEEKSQASWCLILTLAIIMPYACLTDYWIAGGVLVLLGRASYYRMRQKVEGILFSVTMYLVTVLCYLTTTYGLLVSWLNQDWWLFGTDCMTFMIGCSIMVSHAYSKKKQEFNNWE